MNQRLKSAAHNSCLFQTLSEDSLFGSFTVVYSAARNLPGQSIHYKPVLSNQQYGPIIHNNHTRPFAGFSNEVFLFECPKIGRDSIDLLDFILVHQLLMLSVRNDHSIYTS